MLLTRQDILGTVSALLGIWEFIVGLKPNKVVLNTFTYEVTTGDGGSRDGNQPYIQLYDPSGIQIGEVNDPVWIAAGALYTSSTSTYRNKIPVFMQLSGWSDDICLKDMKWSFGSSIMGAYLGDYGGVCGQGVSLTGFLIGDDNDKIARCVWMGAHNKYSSLGKVRISLQHLDKSRVKSTLKSGNLCTHPVTDYTHKSMVKNAGQIRGTKVFSRRNGFAKIVCTFDDSRPQSTVDEVNKEYCDVVNMKLTKYESLYDNILIRNDGTKVILEHPIEFDNSGWKNNEGKEIFVSPEKLERIIHRG